MMKAYRPLWIALFVMAAVSPVGLYLPELFEAGAAWGEWSVEELAAMVGYAPASMRKLADLWGAPVADYALPGQGGAPLTHRSLAYVASALLGIGVCGAATYGLSRWLVHRKR